MAVLQAADIADLANMTLDELGRFRMVDLMSDIREHVAMSNMMRKERVSIQAGEAITWNLIKDADENAKNVGLYNRDDTNVKDGEFTLTIPWRHTQTSCAFDVREAAMNRSPAKIVDYVKAKQLQSQAGLVKLMEENFWQGVSSSSDSETPWGLFGYWIDGSNMTTTPGFNGQNGNYGSIGGKDASTSTYTRLRHQAYQYSNVTDTDLVDGLRDMLVYSNFKPTVGNAPVKGYTNGHRRAMYSTWDTCKGLEKLARSNNDSLGVDLDRYHKQVTIQGVNVYETPWLTENKATSDPVVGIDWKQLHTCVLAGRFGVNTPFGRKDGQHNVMEKFQDFSYNFRVYDRRQGLFLAAKSDPLSS